MPDEEVSQRQQPESAPQSGPSPGSPGGDLGSSRWFEMATARDEWWAVAGGVGVGAVLGTTARYGLGKLVEPIAVGCFLMGFMVALKPKLQPPHPTVYAAATTGFCGCCTTFSAYMVAVVTLWVDGSVLQALLCILAGVAAAHSGLRAGMSVAKVTRAAKMPAGEPTAPIDLPVQEADPALWIRQKLLVYWVTLVVSAGFAVALFALDFVTVLLIGACAAPTAAWTRWVASKRNPADGMPVCTLLCNTIAVALSAGVAAALGSGSCPEIVTGSTEQDFLKGISLGFCGGLSTVSTLTDECRRLAEKNERRGWLYFLATIACGHLAGLAVLIPVRAGYECL
eukprot:TRINITY_DN15993_c0_g1_i2.p1 TRINITY_DN15993_c0_g1~~TRINITY_DN15993_c0_g1_i2.p1  ORF type:complete len:373 (+),score=46.70 TRINITY_DN15993_c0_g1_i2:101-1120(+)